VDGVYSFARIDTKDQHNNVIEWEFDLRTFPKLVKEIQRLTNDAQALSRSLAKLVFGPLDQA